MRIAVSGGAGFIGSHVVDALHAQGHVVVVIDDLSTGRAENLAHLKGKPGVRIILGDVEEVRMQAVGGLDAFVHCAALSSVNDCEKSPGDAWDMNVDMTWRAMELAKVCKAERFVFVSTAAIWAPIGIPGTDYAGRLNDPKSAYARTKLAAELAVATFWPVGGRAVRLANVYGPRQRPDLEAGVIAKWMRALKDGAESIGVTGDGQQTRDFVYVESVAHTLAMIAEAGDLGDLDARTGYPQSICAAGRTTPIKDLAEIVWTVCGREGPAVIKPLPLPKGEVRFTPILPRTCHVDLVDGLRKTWEAVR